MFKGLFKRLFKRLTALPAIAVALLIPALALAHGISTFKDIAKFTGK